MIPGQLYYKSMMQIERLQRLFLEILKVELDRLGVRDMNNVQAMLLYNINHERIAIGELTIRSYYVGTNVTYNLRKLLDSGYLYQEKSDNDRRSSFVFASPKGQEFILQIKGILAAHKKSLEDFSMTREDLVGLLNGLNQLEGCLYRLSLIVNRPLEDT